MNLITSTLLQGNHITFTYFWAAVLLSVRRAFCCDYRLNSLKKTSPLMFIFKRCCDHSVMRKFLLLLSISSAFARSPLRYDAIFIMVVVELSFAFAVGIACILFSLNMFRALNRSPEVYRSLPIGDFPRPLPTCSAISGKSYLLQPFVADY